MTIDILWKLFNKTGNIKYYNLMMKLKKWCYENDNRNIWRNHIEWN